jgi:hypothetical protein
MKHSFWLCLFFILLFQWKIGLAQNIDSTSTLLDTTSTIAENITTKDTTLISKAEIDSITFSNTTNSLLVSDTLNRLPIKLSTEDSLKLEKRMALLMTSQGCGELVSRTTCNHPNSRAFFRYLLMLFIFSAFCTICYGFALRAVIQKHQKQNIALANELVAKDQIIEHINLYKPDKI